MAKVFLERFRARRHILHGVVLLVGFLVEAVARGPVAFVEVVPIAAQRLQAIEIQFLVVAFIDDQLFLEIGLFLFHDLAVSRFIARRGLVGGDLFLFEDRVFLELLLNALLKRHDGQLQNLHRLNHAGGQNHPLVHPLA